MAVKHMGPALIGQEKYDAAQAYVRSTGGGLFGPALLGDQRFNQSGPVGFKDGIPVFAGADD